MEMQQCSKATIYHGNQTPCPDHQPGTLLVILANSCTKSLPCGGISRGNNWSFKTLSRAGQFARSWVTRLLTNFVFTMRTLSYFPTNIITRVRLARFNVLMGSLAAPACSIGNIRLFSGAAWTFPDTMRPRCNRPTTIRFAPNPYTAKVIDVVALLAVPKTVFGAATEGYGIHADGAGIARYVSLFRGRGS